MAYTVNFSPEFRAWWNEQERELKKTILRSMALLEQHGPHLKRPHADTLEGSSLSNLKELRVPFRGDPYRILFAFDPKREALLLIGGNKAEEKRWYRKMIPLAEEIFNRHLASLDKEDK